MRIISPSFQILNATPNLEKTIEMAGRTCYKSEDKITDDSADVFIQKMKSLRHASTLEHGSITVRFIADRGVTHELVRHRFSSFSQESTRYCSYNKSKFSGQITVIEPFFFVGNEILYNKWKTACLDAEASYLAMIELSATAQEARSVLPNSIKTEIVMTANPREWKHVFDLRCSKEAHPQIRQIMIPCAVEFAKRWPSLFGEFIDFTHPSPADQMKEVQ